MNEAGLFTALKDVFNCAQGVHMGCHVWTGTFRVNEEDLFTGLNDIFNHAQGGTHASER